MTWTLIITLIVLAPGNSLSVQVSPIPGFESDLACRGAAQMWARDFEAHITERDTLVVRAFTTCASST